MKHLLKYGLWTLAGIVCLFLILLSPVAYVEVFCQVDSNPQPYQAIIEEDHHRPETNTLMTYPEWHIVHAYEDYAEVLRAGDPHDYGYIKGVTGFWSSLCSLSKTSAAHGEIATQTKQMVYVIGVSFSAELGLKALYEETFGRIFVLLRGSQRATLDELSAKQAANYAQFLRQVPWYKWQFREDAQALDEAGTHTLRDTERNIALGIEYSAKAAYAEVIAKAAATTGTDELTLRMVVAETDPSKLEVYNGVKVIEETSNGTIIETPRYRELTILLQKMARDGIEFIEIAGNDDILFTVTSQNGAYAGAIASMQRQGFGDYRHLVVVPVKELAEQLNGLGTTQAKLEHIHDY